MRAAAGNRELGGRQPGRGGARRGALLRSSALQAVALAALGLPVLPAGVAAQSMPAPNQLPTGGKVFTGSAAIATSGNTLNVNQASQNAGINWHSFSIGSQATVAIHTPGAQALTINRVVGPDPSVIAGRLNSNGQVVITNQSGVTFTQGSQVNVQSLIASAPGISEANAKAGRLVFDQRARPGAAVVNHGTITVGQTGLAALVAPQVANSGAIRAHLGRVVLAGAAAHTVDLYGDGLLSIDVSKQVTTVPVGPDGKPVTALVTNTGTILADGGSIVLTAKAVDGLVTTLVDAGGTISAATKNGTPGRIVIAGTGGDVILRGVLAARGPAAGAKGGEIEVNAPGHKVTVAPGAVVDASGRAGGGVVAVGTTLARAKGGPSLTAPTAKHVTIAAGAKLAADATGSGDGGVVTVLSKGGATIFQGAISAQGGPGGGNGGAVEVSGDYLALLGSVNVLAPMGAAGSVLLDPGDIEIVTDGTAASITLTNPYTGPDGTTVLDYTQINKLSGNVTLQATGNITMTGAMDLTGKDAAGKNPHIDGLAMLANGDITISAALTGKSGIILSAGASFTPPGGSGALSVGSTTAKLTIDAAVTSTGSGVIALGATGGGIAINSTVSTAGGTVNLLSGGGVSEAAGGSIVADTLIGTVTGNVGLDKSATNAISTLGTFTVNAGTLALADSSALTVAGPATGTDVVLSSTATGVALSVTGTVDATGTASLTATAGTLDIASSGTVTGGTAMVLNGAEGITGTGVLIAGTLSGGSSDGGASLTGTNNSVGTLGDFATKLDFTLDDATALTVAGLVSGVDVTLAVQVEGKALTVSGTVQASGTASLSAPIGAIDILAGGTVAGTGAVALTANDSVTATGVVNAGELTGTITAGTASLTGANLITTLGSFTAGGAVTIANTQALSVTGPVSGANITVSTTAGTLGLSGTLDAGATGTLDLSAGAGISQSGGKLVAGVLQSTAGVSGNVALGGTLNEIGALGAFTVSGGDFALTDAVSLSVAGAVKVDDGQAIALTADTYGFGSGGSLDAGSGLVSLIPLSTGTALALDATVAGGLARITAGTISLGGIAGGGGTQAASIDISAPVTTAAVLELHSTGTINQSAGTLDVGGLQGSAAGVSIEQPGNVIPALGAFAIAGGDFRLADSVALDVTGTLNAANVVLTDSASGTALTISGLVSGSSVTLTASAGALALTGKLDAGTGTLDLNAQAGISQTGGSITAGVLLSSLGVTGDVSLTRATNAVSTLGNFTVTAGSFALTDAGALAVSGAVSANDVTLSAPTLDITGAVVASGTASLTATTGTLDIATTGTVTGPTAVVLNGKAGITGTGVLGAGVLSGGSTAGGASLTGTGISVGTLGDFATKLDFALDDQSALNVVGTVTGVNLDLTSRATGLAISVGGTVLASGTASLATTAGAVDIGATGTVSGNLAVALQAFGALTAPGVIAAGTLSGGAGGPASLTGANRITTLGSFSAKGDLSVGNSQAMTVTGPVSGTNISLVTSTGLLTLAGTVDATGGMLTLGAGGGISQTGGKLSAAMLQGAPGITGDVALGGSLNAIGMLGAFTVSAGSFALTDASPMVVNGSVKVDAGQAIVLTSDSFNFGIAGFLDAGATGVVSLVPLTGGAALSLSAVTIGELARITAGTISLGGVAGGGGTQAASVDIAGNFTTGAVLELHATGLITQSSGTLSVGGLAGSAFGMSIELPGNVIPRLGVITLSGGDLRLADSVPLDVTGSLSAANIVLTDSAAGTALTISGTLASGGMVTLTTTGGAMVLSGVVSGATLDLNSVSGISQTGGTLSAGLLRSSLGVIGEADLGSPTNAIATIGGFGVISGGLVLENGGSLGVVGTVSGTGVALTATTLAVTGQVTTGGTASLSATAGGLDIAAGGTVTGLAAVVLNGMAGITESGALIAGTLSGGSGAGSASLIGTNQVSVLGDFVVKTDLVLNDALALTVSGTVGGGNIALSSGAGGVAVNITGTVGATGIASIAASAGQIGLAGALSGASVSLQAASGISGTGVLTAGILSGGVGSGGVNLTGANQVTALGDFSVSQDFVLFNADALAVTGTVSGTNIGLVTGAGGIALSGALDASAIVSLNGGGGVSQSGGSIVAATLMSGFGVSGDVVLGAAGNRINTLAGFAVTGGTFTLADAVPLSVAGTASVLSGGTITLISDALGFAGGGGLNAGTGVVALLPASGTTVITVGGAAAGGIVTGDLSQITAGTIRLGGAAGGGAPAAASILFTGNAATAATLELHASGTILQSAGTLSASSLTGTAFGVGLEQAGNVIPALGSFALGGGDFRLADSVALEITGSLSAANVALTDSAGGTALTITGTVSAGGLVALSATGGMLALNGVVSAATLDLGARSGIVQGGGSLSAGTLLSSGGIIGDVTLTSATNQIGVLGNIVVTGGTLSLRDASALTVAGAVSAASVALIDSAGGAALTVTGSIAGSNTVALSALSGTLALTGTVDAGAGTLDLSAGALSQTGGALVAGLLVSSGGVSGDVTLGQANRVAGLGGFVVSGGAFALTDTVAVSVAGAVVVDGGQRITLTGDGLSFAGAGALDAAGGVVSLVPLTGSAVVTLGGAGPGIAPGDLSRISAGTISLGGIAGGGGVVAQRIDLVGNASTAGVLELHSSGAVVQSAGTLSVASLAGEAFSIDLQQPGNVIPVLGQFAVNGGDFLLADSVPLELPGTLSAPNITLIDSASGTALTISGTLLATGTVALNASAGTLALNGVINAAVLDLGAGGAIVQGGGSLAAGTLLSSFGVTGDVALTSATNLIAALGGFTVTGGDFTLTDAAALNVNGALSATNVILTDSAAGTALTVAGSVAGTDTVTLAAPNGGLALNGVVSAATLDLAAVAGVVQGGGSLAAGTLLSTAGVTGSVALASASNRVATLGGFTVTGGDFTLADAAALAVAGPLSATNITLTDSAGGTALTIGGAVAGTGLVRLSATAGALALNAVASAPTLDLHAASGISQGGGSLSVGTLLSSAGVIGDVNLASSTNRIATLGGFAVTGGGFTLSDAVALSVAGPLSAGDIRLSDSAAGSALTVSGPITGSGGVVLAAANGGLALNGVVSAATLDLNAAAGVSQGGGSIVAGTLLSSAGVIGDVALTGTGNRIGAVGGFTVTGGDFTLADAAALTVSGALAAANVALTDSAGGTALSVTGSIAAPGTVTLAASAGGLALSGGVNAAVLDLHAADGINQSGGSLVVGTLLSGAGVTGSVGLTSAANRIATLGGFAVTGGDFALADAVALTVGGPLNAANLAITDSASGAALTVSGPVSGTGTVRLAAGAGELALNAAVGATTLDLGAGQGITQGGGAITAGTLLSSAGVTGDVALTSATNRIGALGGFAVSGGDFTLADAAALTVSGALSAADVALTDSAGGSALTVGGTITATGTVALMTSAGALALNGAVAASVIDLASAAGITQGGGALVAGTLSSGAGVTGSVALTRPANRIGALGDFAVTGGDFTLADSMALDVTGAVSAAGVALSDSAAGTALTVSGSITSTGTVALLASAGGLALNGAVSTVVLDLGAAAGISQGGGSLVTLRLLSSGGVTGSVSIAGTTNQLSTLDDFVVTGGDLTLASMNGLVVEGALSAANITLASAAPVTGISVRGSLAAPGTVKLTASSGGLGFSGVVTASTLDLHAALGIDQGGGSVDVGTLLGRTDLGGATLLGTSNRIATLGDFAVTGGDFRLADSVPLRVAGAVSSTTGIELIDTAPGTALTIAGSLFTPGATHLETPAGALALDGTVTAYRLILESAGGVTQGGGSLDVGTLQGGVSGGDVVLTSTTNRIGGIGNLTVSGALTVTNGAAIAVAIDDTIPARVSAENFTLTMTGAGTAGNVAIAGDVVVPGTFSVTTGGTIVRSGGAFVVGTLTGSAVTLADFGTGANLTTLGAFTVTGSEFVLGNAQPLTITGPLSAEFFRITATGTMTLAGDITTLGETRRQQGLGDLAFASSDRALNNPLPTRGSYLAVQPDGDAPASFIQSGPVTISTTGGEVSTLRIQLLSNGGTITLGDLTAPTTDLLLFPGGSGVAGGTGLVDLYGLLVAGRGGKSDLSGKIATVGGEAAAHLADITPLPDASYRFNACPIGSVNCVLAPIGVLPPANPLHNFVIGEVRGDEDDLDLILPNVADEDY